MSERNIMTWDVISASLAEIKTSDDTLNVRIHCAMNREFWADFDDKAKQLEELALTGEKTDFTGDTDAAYRVAKKLFRQSTFDIKLDTEGGALVEFSAKSTIPPGRQLRIENRFTGPTQAIAVLRCVASACQEITSLVNKQY